MLRPLGHPVATCCEVLGIVCSNLKMVRFFIQHLWMLHDVVVVCSGSCNNVVPKHAHQLDFQYPTPCSRVAKRAQHVGRTMLQYMYVAFNCCDRLAGGCKCWANNVGICCVEMLQLFGLGFTCNCYTFGYCKFPLFCTIFCFQWGSTVLLIFIHLQYCKEV